MENDIERGNLYPQAGRDTETRYAGEGTFRGGEAINGPLKASVDPAFEARRRAREMEADRNAKVPHPVDQCSPAMGCSTRQTGRAMLAQKADEYRMRAAEMTMRALSLEKLLVTIPLELPPAADEALWSMARQLA